MVPVERRKNNGMNYKNWPYWVKGGVTGFLVSFIVLSISIYISGSHYCWDVLDPVTQVASCTPQWNFSINFQGFLFITKISAELGMLGLGLGALIGHLYGKLKTHKQSL